MSETSYHPTNRDWLRRLLSRQPHQIIGGAEHPYMLRWYLVPRNPMLNVYLHKFMRSDDDRALHDHPWWFVSLMLRGQYDEITEAGTLRRRAGSIAFRRAEWRHRVQLLPTLVETGRLPKSPPLVRFWKTSELPCWTLIVTGRRVRTWGFWCKELVGLPAVTSDEPGNRSCYLHRFVPWTEFGDAGCGETA